MTPNEGNPSDSELVITRIFNAPCALVWQAWTDPKHIQQWWGPTGFQNEKCECDLQVGGCFCLEMRAPDGNVYPCIGTFREIVEHERIVYDGEAVEGHPCGAGIPPRAVVTVSFAEQEGKTHLILHTQFATAELKGGLFRVSSGTRGFSGRWIKRNGGRVKGGQAGFACPA